MRRLLILSFIVATSISSLAAIEPHMDGEGALPRFVLSGRARGRFEGSGLERSEFEEKVLPLLDPAGKRHP